MICHLSISQPFWRWGELVFSSLLSCQVQHRPCLCLVLKLDWLQATAGAWIIYRLVPLHWHKRDTLPSMPWLVRAKRELKSNLKNFFYVLSFLLSNEDILSVGFNDFANIQSAFFRSQKGHRRPRESIEEKQLFPTIDFRSRICYLHRFWTEKMAKVH